MAHEIPLGCVVHSWQAITYVDCQANAPTGLQNDIFMAGVVQANEPPELLFFKGMPVGWPHPKYVVGQHLPRLLLDVNALKKVAESKVGPIKPCEHPRTGDTIWRFSDFFQQQAAGGVEVCLDLFGVVNTVLKPGNDRKTCPTSGPFLI